MRAILLVCFIIGAVTQGLFAQNPEGLFKLGNQHYQEQRYEEAIAAYEQITVQEYESAALYYNLGNAYYKTGRLASCLLNYERALRLAPGDEDIRYNLDLARQATVDQIEALPQPLLSVYWKRFSGSLSPDNWGLLSLVFLFAGLLAMAVYFYANRAGIKKFLFFSALNLLIFGIFSLILALQQFRQEQNVQEAIVFEANAYVKSAPNENGEDAFILHEGTKVRVLEVYNGWKKIKIADGKVGWIDDGAVTRI